MSWKIKQVKTCGLSSFPTWQCLFTLVLLLVSFHQRFRQVSLFQSLVFWLYWQVFYQVWDWFPTWVLVSQWSVVRSFLSLFLPLVLTICSLLKMQCRDKFNIRNFKTKLLMDWEKLGLTLQLQQFVKL